MQEEDSFQKFKALILVDPQSKLWFDRCLVETYDQFIDVLYQDVDSVISKLQERKQIYHDAKEDVITMYLVDMLSERGYIVAHDQKIGGHVDITVRGRNPTYLWLGEAKRDKGPEWIGDGFQQLCRRYSDAGQNHTHGGILLYCQGKFATRILKNWRDVLEKTTEFEELKVFDCARTPQLAFTSSHIHDTSGLAYIVRHMAVALFHQPTV